MWRISIVFSLCIIFCSCQRDFNLDIKEAEKQLVVEGIISLQKGVEVILNHTINIGDTVYYDNSAFVNNAEILLANQNLEIIDTIQNINDGFYYSSSIDKLKADHTYKLLIDHMEYGTLESEWVTIPKDFSKLIPKIDISNNFIEIEIEFQIGDDVNNIAYTMGYLESAARENIEFNYTSLGFNDCERTFFPFRKVTSIFNQDCFNQPTNKYISNYSYSGSLEGLNFNIGLISEEAFDYFNSINNQPIGIDQLFTSPILLKSNIIGGIGFIAGYNEVTIPVR